MSKTCWPMDSGWKVTDEFGWQDWRGAVHWGVDFGREGGSGGNAVYAVRAGTVTMSGPAHGFGQWVVIDHPASAGGGTTVYGHIVPEVRVGQQVQAGERIATISAVKSWATNGDVNPHLHLEWHRTVWAPVVNGKAPDRLDPLVALRAAGAVDPGQRTDPPVPAAPEANEGIWLSILLQKLGPVLP